MQEKKYFDRLDYTYKLFVIIALAMFYIWVRFSAKIFRIIPIVVLMFFPMLLHDVSQSLLNFFILGMGVGMLADFIERKNSVIM